METTMDRIFGINKTLPDNWLAAPDAPWLSQGLKVIRGFPPSQKQKGSDDRESQAEKLVLLTLIIK